MHTLYLFLALIAVICFLVAAFFSGRAARTVPVAQAVCLIALGLAAWSLVDLVHLIRTT